MPDSPVTPPYKGGVWNNPVLAGAIVKGGAPFDLTCNVCDTHKLVKAATGAIICGGWCDVPGDDTIETWGGPSIPDQEQA